MTKINKRLIVPEITTFFVWLYVCIQNQNANILFKNGTVKLADFGLSTCLLAEVEVPLLTSSSNCSVDHKIHTKSTVDKFKRKRCNPYTAPEFVLLGRHVASYKSDQYSVGCVIKVKDEQDEAL